MLDNQESTETRSFVTELLNTSEIKPICNTLDVARILQKESPSHSHTRVVNTLMKIIEKDSTLKCISRSITTVRKERANVFDLEPTVLVLMLAKTDLRLAQLIARKLIKAMVKGEDLKQLMENESVK